MTSAQDVDSSAVDGSEWIVVDAPSTCAAVRRRAAEMARRTGLPPDQVEEVSVVASELATNLVKHARDGSVLLRPLHDDGRPGVGVLTLDRGPGTRDIAGLAVDGVTTTGTLGIGLGAVRRFADRLDLHSVPGVGTIVSAEFHLHHAESEPSPDAPSGSAPDDFGGLTRPIPGESVCGDAYAQRLVPGGRLVMLADGLGHGLLAARASRAAVRTFHASRAATPAAVLDDLHRSLRESRGAAIAVAHLDHRDGTLTFGGVGNISARILDLDRSSSITSQPGIVGHNVPRVRELPFRLDPGQWLVLHSDGLTERWTLDELPGILASSPVVLSAALLRAAGVRRDDASVVALQRGRPAP